MSAQVLPGPADVLRERRTGVNVSESEEFRRIEGRPNRNLVDRAISLPEVRLGKVDALRLRLAAGRYVADATEVARAIVEFERDWKR